MDDKAQVQRRTATPFTMTVLQTTTGLRTTTAPRGPGAAGAKDATAQTTALASVGFESHGGGKASRRHAISRKERMLVSGVTG